MQSPDETGPTLIGMLTPSSNTVVEPYTSALAWPLFPDVSVHYGRLRVTRIALDEGSDSQFGADPVLAAADLLADAKVDVIAWNGTSASWLGFDSDDRLCAALTERTGARATTAIKSLNRLLAAFGVRKLGLVTPYTPDVQQQIIANYAAHRDRDRGRAAQQPVGQFLFRGALRRRDRGHVPRGGRGAADAIAIVCTNMRGPLVAAGLERELGIPVLDSVAFTLWGCLKEAGTDMTPLSEFGMMFSK